MPGVSDRELYRQAYFSVPEEAVLTPETLKKALLSKQFTMIWYDESFFTVLEAADPELAALTVPAFMQYAGVVDREEDKAMVTILTLGGNPLYAECGLRNYRAVLSTEAARAALAAQQARQEEKIRHVIQKIESVTE